MADLFEPQRVVKLIPDGIFRDCGKSRSLAKCRIVNGVELW